jgi:hypothetical protein
VPAAYFHGGVPNLEVGQSVLPPTATGAESMRQKARLRDGVDRPWLRDDRVYLTTDLSLARQFAAIYRRCPGDLYIVVPQGEVEPDPDWHGDPGGSVMCPAATIVEVLERRVGRLTSPYSGFVQRPPSARAEAAISELAEDLRRLSRVVSFRHRGES